MNRIIVCLLAMVLSASILVAQEEMPQDMSDAENAWGEFMTPGEYHKILEKAAGEWTYKIKYWETPDGETNESEGTYSSKMIFGGRYLESSYTGSFSGMPFEARTIEAYDNAKEKFISIWIDNMGTGITTAEGLYDKENNEIVYEGKSTDPVTKGDYLYKEIIKIIDENTMSMTMYTKTAEGEEFKTMESILTRK